LTIDVPLTLHKFYASLITQVVLPKGIADFGVIVKKKERKDSLSATGKKYTFFAFALPSLAFREVAKTKQRRMITT